MSETTAAPPKPVQAPAQTGGSSPSPAHSHHARRIVAVDGPAGAGKSTVAARIAARFGLMNLETGAMYRAFALKALRQGVSPEDALALEALTCQTTLTLQAGEGGNRVILDGEDVTSALRTPEITQAASRVSVHLPIRTWLVSLQRQLGSGGGVVMEGRDIGTAVFPDADVKVFLDASPEARSQRRYEQGNLADAEADTAADRPKESSEKLQQMTADMRERDHRDRNRAESPLRPADDAVVIDSTALTLDQVVEQVSALITARWAAAPRP